MWRTITFLIVSLASRIEAAEPIRGFCAERCFELMGLQVRNYARPHLTEHGVAYWLKKAPDDYPNETRCNNEVRVPGIFQGLDNAAINGILFAVHPDIESATAVLRDVAKISIGFDPDECVYPIGDEGYFYSMDDLIGHIRFRRQNLSVIVEFDGPLPEVLPRIRELDALIEHDPTVALRGSFPERPRISKLRVVGRVSADTIEVVPETVGLGHVDALQVKLESVYLAEARWLSKDRWGLEVLVLGDSLAPPDASGLPRPLLSALPPITPATRGNPAIIRVIVANDDNVFVSRDFEVPVAL